MAAKIQKLEAAARMAMGHFEVPGNATQPKPQNRFLRPAYALLALAVVALVLALL